VPRARLYRPRQVCYNPASSLFCESFLKPGPSMSVRPPTPAYAEQGAVFRRAFSVLQKAIAQHAFPAASIAVTHRGKLAALKAFGHFTYEPDSPLVNAESVFDVASVTKVVATTTMAMILCERGLLDLEMPLVAVVPEFAGEDERRSEVSFHQLLAHSSGLPAYEKLFLGATNRADLLQAAFSVALKADPGTKAEYSDIGFILLGVALERIADESLDRFCQREVFGPLGMTQTAFNPPEPWRESAVPTTDDQSFRHRVIQGEVQDENAGVLGGVAGHAGLFSTAGDVATFAGALIAGGQPLVRPETLALFTRRESSPKGTSRALGWDTPSAPSQSGKYFSANSYGHLGYTGTSLWIEPQRELSVTLLTNRTWPDCANQAIKQVRPAFHDAVIEALESR
jgi:CubicO group peptidase (beta-lactamase class C family)